MRVRNGSNVTRVRAIVYRSTARWVKATPWVTGSIGMSILAYSARRAIANAQNKDGFSGDVDRLFVSACYANQGPSAKRVRPAPMGRAFRVLKRTAHLTVHVSERPDKVVAVGTTAAGEAPRPKRARAAKSATTPSTKRATKKAKE